MVRQVVLARRTLGGAGLWTFAVGASSPMTVLVGGIVATYALTGVVGTPLAFGVLAVVVGLLFVSHVGLARHVAHAAPFYAQLAVGVGPAVGVAGAFVALLGYSAIQISLYPLVGTTLSGLFGGVWWAWAVLVGAVVAVLGLLPGVVNARVLSVLLVVELAVIVLFILAAFAHPAGGGDGWQALRWSSLMVAGMPGALAFAMAAFVGAELPAVFGEEARSGRTVARASMVGVGFLGVLYLLASWAFAVHTGPTQVAAAARDPLRGPLAVLSGQYGSGIEGLATCLLVTSVTGAMLAFHATVARYVFATAREGVFPARFARVGVRGGPVAGSRLQSLLSVGAVAGFAGVGADPMGVMFTWLSTVGAVCVLVLLVSCSWAAWGFFTAGRGGRESVLVRQVAPVVGGVTGFLAVVFMLSNLGSLLGTPPGSWLPWLVPILVAAVAVVGLGRGLWMRVTRREAYARLGRGTPDAVTVPDQRLAALDV